MVVYPEEPRLHNPLYTLITNGEDHTNGGASTKSSGDPAQSKTPRTSRNIMHENRETWMASAAQSGGRPVGKGESRTTHRHAVQGSDLGVVPVKGSNKEGKPTAESLEGRPGTKENVSQSHMPRHSAEPCMAQGLEGVRCCLTPSSNVGAVCGKSARTDLCGG